MIDHHHSHHYHPREKYSVSHGAQPWKHKHKHRRGVAYRNPVVKQRYYTDSKFRDHDSHSSGSGKHFTSQDSKSRNHQDARYNPGNKAHDKHRGNNYSPEYSRERAPSFQNTQAELKQRRTTATNSTQPSKERANKDRHDNARHDNQVKQLQAKASRDQTKDNPQQKQYQGRDAQQRKVESRTQQQQQKQRQETRPEVKLAGAQRSEQPRQATPTPKQSTPKQATPKQREEVRVKQSEPHKNMQTARANDHKQGKSAQSQERHNKD